MAKNKKAPVNQVKDLGFFGELWRQIRLVYYLVKDPEVPIYLKLLPFLGIFYILFPIDVIADVVPVLGQLDDLTILVIGLKVFIEMAPPQVVERYLGKMSAEKMATIVEGEATDVTHSPILLEGDIVDDGSILKSDEKAKQQL